MALSTATALPPAPSLAAPAVARALGISVATLYRLIQSGDAPASYRVGRVRRLWRAADVAEWLESRRDGAAA